MALKRNLIYFCYLTSPDELDGSTKLGLMCLERFKNVFDGQIILFIAYDSISDEFEEKTKKLFEFFGDYELYFVQNNSESRESEHFIDSVKKINDHNTITFYAHNKGKTHNINMGGLAMWISSMFFFNLENEFLHKIEENLSSQFTFAGIYKKIFEFFGGGWHYSGAFFWFNTKKLLCKDTWDHIGKGRMGIESYPGQMCSVEESFTLMKSYHGDFPMNDPTLKGILNESGIETEMINHFEEMLYKMKMNL